MNDKTAKLKQALGGNIDGALSEVLKSELYKIFSEFMEVERISVELNEDGITVRAKGDGIKRVGYYCPISEG